MSFLLPVLIFAVLMGGFYALIGRTVSRRDGVAILLALAAVVPVAGGCLLLGREYSRSQDGQVVSGVVTGKFSSTGADGTHTIGGGRRSWRTSRRVPWIFTANGFRYYDVLGRLILTGSTDAWVIAYRYPCDASRGCFARDFVSRELWVGLREGQPVNIRTARGEEQGRLDENPQWSTAAAHVAIGTTLALAAGLVSGRLRLRRRRKYVTAPAVVTAVEPVTLGDEVHWRVRFAYFGPDGAACESADQVSIEVLRPGDDCIAVYPPEHPDLGTLRLIPDQRQAQGNRATA